MDQRKVLKKNQTQYQVGIKLPASLAAVQTMRMVLMSAGFDGSLLVEEEGRAGKVLSLFFCERGLAQKALLQLRALHLKKVRLFMKTHHERDWSTAWKRGWKPFSLTRRFHVIPLWQDKRTCPRGKMPIYLETTNAFGTGLHETTRFTAGLIEALEGAFSSFLDVGTGSGILAIVALKCGATRVAGFDIDPDAVRAAHHNLKANGLACSLKAADVKDFEPARLFDLVAANLITQDLMEFRDRIVSCVQPGGHLIISGVSLKNVPKVKKAFALPFLAIKIIVKGKEWAAFLFEVTP
ncbi:MAG: 50S ribosomal protein L11 methyltransferase [Candidatus Omnitrophica bacterium]|nr:50S ribosomal protein L11 methyltransferase [Candidatus Omnitrophota bacterium]